MRRILLLTLLLALLAGGWSVASAAERIQSWLNPGPYEILSSNKEPFVGTGRRHIVLERHAIALYDEAALVWRSRFDGGSATLHDVVDVLRSSPRVSWLEEGPPGVFTLRAAITQAPGTSLEVAAPTARILRLSSETETYLSGWAARIRFAGVRVTSWDPGVGAPEADVGSGRPFIAYRESRMTFEDADVGHLGSDRFRAYGVNWDTGSTGFATGSTFHDNFFGAFSSDAHDIAFRGNVFRDNVLYGLDPHTHTTGLIVEDNEAYGNGSHGIIFSLGVSGLIRNNRAHDNRRNGIVLDRQSNGNVVEGNIVMDNEQDGIVLIGSSATTLRGNTIAGSRVGIRINEISVGNSVLGNRIRDNQQGVQVYGGARETTLNGNSITGSLTSGMVLEAPATRSTGDVVYDAPAGVEIRGPATLRNTKVSGVDRGLVVESTGIAQIDDVTIRAHDTALDVAGSGVVRVANSVLRGAVPIRGQLRLNLRNHLETPRVTPPYLEIAGAAFIFLAIVLHALQRLRHGPMRELKRADHARTLG